MSKFWQKKYISKYTGEEIDAAVEAANGLPEIPEKSWPKFIIVSGDNKYALSNTGLLVAEPTNEIESEYYSLSFHKATDDHPKYYDINLEPFFKIIEAPEALNTKISTVLVSMATALMGDLKYHKATITGSSSDADFEDINDFITTISDSRSINTVNIANFGIVFVEKMLTGNSVAPRIHNYADVTGMGLGELLAVFTQPTETTYSIDFYARRCDVAT